nr:hypothetical protein [Tanacetum cinerariifolium]
MPSFNAILRAFASLGHDMGNSYVYDPNPNSFDCPPDSYHPPHPTYETYSYDSYGNDSQFGHDCQPQFPLNYESEPSYIENYNSYPYDSSSPPQSPVIHQPPQELSIQEMEDLKQQYLDELKRLSNLEYRDEIKIAELTENFNVALHYLLSLRNEDTIFDPGICNSRFSRPAISHRCGTFPRFHVLPESPMEIFSSTCSPIDK